MWICKKRIFDEVENRMTTRKRRNGRRSRRLPYSPGIDDTNPMDSLLNLSDIMLVLAVGIMLALVLHWNVPLGPAGGGDGSGTGLEQTDRGIASEALNQTAGQTDGDKTGAISLDRDDLTNADKIPEGSKRIGNVYYDEKTGNYYILQE